MPKKATVPGLCYTFTLTILPIQQNYPQGLGIDLEWDLKPKPTEITFQEIETTPESGEVYFDEFLYLHRWLPEIVHEAIWAARQEAARTAAEGFRRKFTMTAGEIGKELTESRRKRMGRDNKATWTPALRKKALAEYEQYYGLIKKVVATKNKIKMNNIFLKICKVHSHHPEFPREIIEELVRNGSTVEELALQFVAWGLGAKPSYVDKELTKARKERRRQ